MVSNGHHLAARDALVGEVLEGKWRVVRVLGAGGMGVVVLAEDVGLKREVAIKLLASHLLSDGAATARFEREARLTASLEHPNIVAVHAVGRHGARPFFVMKYLQGQSLRDWALARQLPLPHLELRGIVSQIAAGLAFLHQRKLVHRDVKPANIFVGPDGHVTVLDCGIMRELQGQRGLTAQGEVVGTIDYMSPEQIQGESVDERSDIYSLGVILYELIAGVPPFEGGNTFVLAEKHVRQAPPRLTQPWVTDAMAAVIDRALAKKPQDRFGSVTELAQAFDAALVGPARARRAPLVVAVAAPVLLAACAALALLFTHREPAPAPALPPPPAPASPAAAVAEPATVGAEPEREPEPERESETAPPTRPARPPRASRKKPAVAAAPKVEPPAVVASPPVSQSAQVGAVRVVTVLDGQMTWAALRIDGKPEVNTPTEVEVAAGQRRIEVTRGAQTITRVVEVKPGQRAVVRIELSP